MKKLSTLYKKDSDNLGRVINEVNPENQWVIDGEGTPSRKWDGTACMIKDGQLYKRYDSKIDKRTGKRKPVPEGAVPCQEPDKITGHWPHWVLCDRNNPADKYHWEAFDNNPFLNDSGANGTFELVGPKINDNKEHFDEHILFKHGVAIFYHVPTKFDDLKEWLSERHIEGVVWHHTDGRMCKIRRKDFGLKW